MQILIYNLGIKAYTLVAVLMSFFNKKARQFINGRKHIYKNIPSSWNEDQRAIAHFHAASLGEFEQAKPVLEAFKKHYPSYKILLTFFSPSGYEIKKNYSEADYICYLPFDNKRACQKFVTTFNPQISFFCKI
ncbi:hypothetical protein OAH12_02705 [Cyclobacteriaceae bacterium]|nr:hypothetical protein [Cyclobacteriaceae bacterium]